eukprot:RCo038617
MQEGCVVDGTISQSGAEAQALWRLREEIPMAMARLGHNYKYDVSLPVPRMYELVEAVRKRLAHRTDAVAIGYGHVGDGNLHLNVARLGVFCPELKALLEPFVYEFTSQTGGSISAEHGIGQQKLGYLHLKKSPECIAVMRQLKRLFDPHLILNPYKVLPDP